MPDYRITDPQTGRTITLRGPGTPTEAEISQAFASTTPEPSVLSKIGTAVKDVGAGALKGLGSSVVGAGQLMANVPGIPQAIDAVYGALGAPVNTRQALSDALKQPELTPQNTAQHLGMMGEQVGEYFLLPTGKGTMLRQIATQGAGSGLLAALQGGSGAEAVTAGAFGAAGPVVGKAASKVGDALKSSAVQGVVQALGPTKERFKAMAEKVAPDILKRGLAGRTGLNRQALLAVAKKEAMAAGKAVDEHLQTIGGNVVDTGAIVGELERAKNAFTTTRTVTAAELASNQAWQKVATQVGPDAFTVPIVLDKRPVAHLTQLQRALESLGKDATVEQVVAARRVWDQVVAGSGGYAQRASGAIGVPLAEQSEAWAKRKATSAIRRVLSSADPKFDALNKEFSFWKTVQDVTAQTLKRTQPQKGGLGKTIMASGGAVVGAMEGDTYSERAMYALLGSVAAAKLEQAITSPRWKLASAQIKYDLAEALVNGQAERAAVAVNRLAIATGVQAAK